MPKVSVIMSVYNDAAYLKGSIESILKQTYSDFEFLITNDGSTDGSMKILEEYSAKDERIKVFNQTNIGLTRTLNNSIKQANGELIARMDADDISLPNRLARETAFLDNHPNVAVVSTFAKVINDQGEVISEHRPGLKNEDIKKLIFFSGQLCHPAVMFRKKEFLFLGGYDENFLYAQDLDLWFKFLAKYTVSNIPDFLFLWRKTASGIGVEKFKQQRYYAQLAKWQAIKNGLYPRYYIFCMLWPYLTGLVPSFFKHKIKKIIVK